MATRQGWSPEVLQLATLLMLSPDKQTRIHVTDLFRAQPRPSRELVVKELGPLVSRMVVQTAEAMATALGADFAAIVRYGAPNAVGAEFKGSNGIERRLDRAWGGPSMASLEALVAMRLVWPGPRIGHFLLLHGAATVNGKGWNQHQMASLICGDEMMLQPGGVALLQAEPVALVTEAALAAGVEIPFHSPPPGLAARSVLATAAGRMVLDHQVLHLNQRQIVLTANEAQAMARLTRTPGQIVERSELARLLGVRPRGLDRVVVS
ncbi:MAG: hypothetical protein ACRD2D_11585, partial [Terriglobales bacterium]